MAHELALGGLQRCPFSIPVVAVGLVFPLLSPTALQAQAPRGASTSVVENAGMARATITVDGPGRAFHPSRVLVRFRGGARRDVLPGSGSARALSRDGNLQVVETPLQVSVAEAVRGYRANPNVLYAEPDLVVSVLAAPSDPLWAQQWDMTKISAPAAWDTQTNAGDAVVAVIDTGIDYTHPDLQGNLWTAADGSHGFTCMNGSCVPGGPDDYGHGTHVAGTIGAVANNGTGMAGINWGVQLLSIKFLGANGSGYLSGAILGFNKLIELKRSGVNIRLTSNSWGGGGYSQSLKDAMAAAENEGMLHVCAAGNSGQNADASPMYPAAYDNR